ncbi:hypothetical protein BDN72DRAFT_966214 [Pluteus cervinus]|uniref:Uncharacterized protein n=1 Tax=Pluteus cervinus TaxID=181527 RepID=A0ACD2ZZV5_9AGAR|nr:hypothetical protein BDN72DRAFT_966214 [Pluteus cervinus]
MTACATGVDLPVEVIEHIISWIDGRRDLISFACTSQAWKAFVIPRHTEYRVLRITGCVDWIPIWDHLQRRPDLASNLRVLHFVYTDDVIYRGGIRVPKTLLGIDGIPTSPPEGWNTEVAKERYEEIIGMIDGMDKLHTFAWEEGWDGEEFDEKDGKLLELVVQKPTLRNMLLMHEGGAVHTLLGLLENRKSSIWKMAKLGGLIVDYNRDLEDDEFHELISQDLNFGPWVQSLSSALTFLGTTPTVFAAHCSNLCLPALTRLSVYRGTGHDTSINAKIETFLQTHPCIEELSWTPTRQIILTANCLPSLRKLACSSELLSALEVATPESNGQRSSSRKIEELGIRWEPCSSATVLTVKDVISLRCLDNLYVKRLRLERLAADSIGELDLLPQAFPNVWHVFLPWQFEIKKARVPLSQSGWAQLLSRFPNLEVFLTTVLVNIEDSQEETISHTEEVVQRFARCCPKLRQITHDLEVRDESNCLDYIVKKVVITREEPGPEARCMAKWLGINDERSRTWRRIRWQYGERAPRDPFQTMPWSDDDFQ